MAKKVNPLAVLATALVGLTVVSGCGAGAQPVKRPFVAGNGAESGPSSGLWGDGSSEPGGLHTGCIRGRRFAVLITVHNRSKRTITLLGGGGPQPFRDVIERVAVQVRLAPPPPKGDLAVIGLRSWLGRNSSPVAIPAGARRLGAVELPHAKLLATARARAGAGEPQHHGQIQRRRQ